MPNAFFEWVKSITTTQTWFSPTIATIVTIACLFIAIFFVFKFKNAHEVSFLTLVIKKPDIYFRELQSSYDIAIDTTRWLDYVITFSRYCMKQLNSGELNGSSEKLDLMHVYIANQIASIYGLFQKDSNRVAIFHPVGDELHLLSCAGFTPTRAACLKFPIHPSLPSQETFASLAFRENKVFVCNDVRTDLRYHRQSLVIEDATYRSIMAVPVCLADHTIAVFTVDSLISTRFGEKEQALGKYLAELLALWIQKSQDDLGQSALNHDLKPIDH